ncbi:hypothetical protein CLV97_14218 [Planifilum fimeticola]|uniref:Uncharacterized protein n=1 Tax=Planifilum fimeticola TaxID=201975 RepID=A0A2T0LA64_9BACL|nr:hypothetical protein [Planifilum fimeticola]PRX38642.1 hypothetical protein CLV97_14218 [Planifilum fimeticola]
MNLNKEFAVELVEVVRHSLKKDFEEIHRRLDSIESRLERVEGQLAEVSEKVRYVVETTPSIIRANQSTLWNMEKTPVAFCATDVPLLTCLGTE